MIIKLIKVKKTNLDFRIKRRYHELLEHRKLFIIILQSSWNWNWKLSGIFLSTLLATEVDTFSDSWIKSVENISLRIKSREIIYYQTKSKCNFIKITVVPKLALLFLIDIFINFTNNTEHINLMLDINEPLII